MAFSHPRRKQVTSTLPKIYLIRHGQTEWSLSGQHTGRTDLPMTPEGERQARELARVLGKIHFDTVFTSPLKRARMTCELSGLADRAEMDDDLVEWDYGTYEGLTSEKIHELDPHWSLFRDGAPLGESAFDVEVRADRVIATLEKLTGNIALFSHGHFICALATRWIGLPILTAEHLDLSTSSISNIGYSEHHPDTRVISGWNSVI
jgi:probable phosphoglycerate mutase